MNNKVTILVVISLGTFAWKQYENAKKNNLTNKPKIK